jgi:hypothetical protein
MWSIQRCMLSLHGSNKKISSTQSFMIGFTSLLFQVLISMVQLNFILGRENS